VPVAIVAWVAHRRLSTAVDRSATKARAAHEHLSELLAPKDSVSPSARVAGDRDPIRQLAGSLASSPEILASGMFAAIAVLGARRTVKLVRAASALASAGAVVAKVAGASGGVHPESGNGCVDGKPKGPATGRR
jgi:hypothetical protein